MKAKYKIVYVDEGVIALVEGAGELSITEDVHAVIADLQTQILVREQRIVYQDTAGIWDEIVLNEWGDFDNFNILYERHLGQVLAKLR